MFRARLRASVWISTILFLLGAAQLSHAAQFLIVENVERLSIYNKYQQESSSRERQLFVPYVPMRILKPNDMLGDGFTPCMQVEIEGQTFYLLKEKDGGLSRSGSLGYETVINNAVVLLDTVQILTGNSILFSPINSRAQHVSSHDSLVRVFRHQTLTYCRTFSEPRVFGWVDFSETKAGWDWMVLKHRSFSGTSISSVSQKIKDRVEEVNRVLRGLFRFFNSQSHQQKLAPSWTVETSGDTVTCTLQGAAHNEQFEQSTFYLVNEIENIALGSEFQVTRSPGRIEIRAK